MNPTLVANAYFVITFLSMNIVGSSYVFSGLGLDLRDLVGVEGAD